MTAALVAFGVVFVAELGDKSQLLALTLATRYRALPVLAGLAIAAAGLMVLAVAAGAALSAALPTEALSVVAGSAFLVFAVLALRSSEGEDEVAVGQRQPGVLTVAGAFAVAELGDKTMLATLALAARNGAVGTWFGATAGIVAASSLAVLVGSQLGARLPERIVRVGAAAMFAAFGVLLLADGLS